jgi:low affinity Fe/Cu permease
MPDDSATATELSLFDRCATYTAEWASKPSFFAICVLVVVAWIPTIWALPTVDTWQLVINTVTNIITFLLVALLQNTQSRSDRDVQQKLQAIADALRNLVDEPGDERPRLPRRLGALTDATGSERRRSAVFDR